MSRKLPKTTEKGDEIEEKFQEKSICTETSACSKSRIIKGKYYHRMPQVWEIGTFHFVDNENLTTSKFKNENK